MENLLDSRSLALRLGVTVATIRRWARNGTIPCLRRGQKFIRYDWLDVVRALKAVNAETGAGRE